MKVLDLAVIVVLLVAAFLLIRFLARAADERRLNRRLQDAPWRRTEYVDDGGSTHVVLRRSVRDGSGAEVLADNDRPIAVVPADAPDVDDLLAAARLRADLSVDHTNYRRP